MIQRMGESSKQLISEFKKMCNSGVVFEGNVVYPVARVMEIGQFTFQNGQLYKVLHGGMGITLPNAIEEEEFYSDIEKDMVEIVLMSSWGSARGSSKPLVRLHSPRAKGFSD